MENMARKLHTQSIKSKLKNQAVCGGGVTLGKSYAAALDNLHFFKLVYVEAEEGFEDSRQENHDARNPL